MKLILSIFTIKQTGNLLSPLYQIPSLILFLSCPDYHDIRKLGLAATRFEIELCMAKDDSWMLSLH